MIKSISAIALLLLSTSCTSLSKLTNAAPRELQFENQYVKVWKATILPKDQVKMHHSDTGHVIVGLRGGDLMRTNQSGATSTIHIGTKSAIWIDADKKGELHGDRNESTKPIEVMVIEVKAALGENL